MISYRLGIDIGSNSVGWAAIRTNGSLPVGILRAGVRIFEAGVHGELAQGREESRGAKRRQMRLQRRRTDRRRRRLKKVYAVLSNYGFLPRGKSSKERLRNLTNLDLELTLRYPETRALPYFLRTCALEAKLHPFELGRALYHLAQRRGFESNRKTRRSEIEDDNGKVLQDVQSLNEAIAQAGVHHTLGEYFARYLPPAERIRSRWTLRRMYVEEFQKILDKQTQYHPDVLTPEFREELWHAIFDQRPLKSQEEKIGECELEPREKRAPLWHPLAQRFRLLQAVNDLRLYLAGSEGHLNREQRANLIAALESKDHLTFRRIRKLLKLPETVAFNHEEGGNDKILGDRTQSAMRDIFGARWDEMTEVQHREAIQDLVSGQTEENLYRKALDVWQLDATLARDYSQRRLPDHGKYLAYSLKAVERLLPCLEQGEAFMTARKSAYPETLRLGAAEDCLRPVTDCLNGLLNPSVIRALTEVRKIVNALIREYGAKPEEIHIELARNLKSPRKEREKRWKLMRAQEARRREAAEKLKRADGNPHPSKEEIDQMLLLMECGGICPYTGRAIGMAEIRNGLVQVEHIIPFSRSLDDTFINKTLCFVDENARKGKLTPWEFYGHTGGVEWEQILARVGKFQSEGRDAKLARFQMKEEQVNALLGNFTERAMNDTRYATKLAAQYLARLYGGLSDESGRKRVYATKGAVTAFLRRLWIFSRQAGVSESGKKVRADHRHHAVDAILAALTDDSVVKRLADAAEQAPPARRFATLEDPWKGFAGEVRSVIEHLIAPHRPVALKGSCPGRCKGRLITPN